MAVPGENIRSWSTTAANNGTADSSINWAEGQTRASVNNSARSQMAGIAKWRDLINGSITTTGTANAQAFSSGLTYTVTPETGLIAKLKIGAVLSNTGACTLNMDSLGAVAILNNVGAALTGGELVAGSYRDFLWNGTNWILTTETNLGPTVTIYTSGSGTFTTAAGTKYLEIECIGAGGGGGAGADGSSGANGSATTFGASISAGGGAAGLVGSSGGAGGTASGATLNLSGGAGSVIGNVGDGTTLPSGGNGGGTKYGGAGVGGAGTVGSAAVANTGAGGGGGGRTVASGYGGGGGGAGGYCWSIISAPAATYAYAVGTGGAGGIVGAAGHPGGAGAVGLIVVKAFS